MAPTSLGIDPAASYKINGYSKYCNITYPENNARVNRFNENNEMKVVVHGNNIRSRISVTSHYGNIRSDRTGTVTRVTMDEWYGLVGVISS